MLRATIVPDRYHKVLLASSAPVLLVIVVAHVIVMATPLHDLLMQPAWSMETASMLQPQDGIRLPLGAQFASMDDLSDCAIVWTVLARQAPGFFITAAVVSTLSVVPVLVPHGLPPLPRTLSPPLSSDWQALLQVFRI